MSSVFSCSSPRAKPSNKKRKFTSFGSRSKGRSLFALSTYKEIKEKREKKMQNRYVIYFLLTEAAENFWKTHTTPWDEGYNTIFFFSLSDLNCVTKAPRFS